MLTDDLETQIRYRLGEQIGMPLEFISVESVDDGVSPSRSGASPMRRSAIGDTSGNSPSPRRSPRLSRFLSGGSTSSVISSFMSPRPGHVVTSKQTSFNIEVSFATGRAGEAQVQSMTDVRVGQRL